MNTKTICRLTATLLASTAFGFPGADAQEIEIVAEATEAMNVVLDAERQVRWEPGQVIVKFKEGADPMTGPQLEAMGVGEANLTRTSGGEMIFTLGEDYATAAAVEEATRSAADLAKRLSERGDVEYAQPNYIVEIAAEPIDPGYAQQWHYFNNGTGSGQAAGGINLPRAWDVTTGDAGVVVAVIDTGILPNHPDIASSPTQLGGYDMITSTFTSQDGDGRDADPTDEGDAVAAGECPPLFINPARGDSWHGTHVAGTVGVTNSNDSTGIAGVSWQGGVVSVRVLGKCGGNVGDINDAVRWAAGMPVPGTPANPNPAQVINMSLGAGIPCSSSPATQAAINDVVARGVTVVVAAGNDAKDAANAMPASCDGVITVAAGNRNGELVTRYSNFGNTIDILAPGGDTQGNPSGGVLSTVQGGYAFYNGTSMASPHVAGVAALMLAADDTLTPQQVEATLKSTAMPRSAAQCPEPCGAGLLDAAAALGVSGGPPSLTAPGNMRLRNGDSETLTVSLEAGGSGIAGETVSFTSSNTAVITVSPNTATTDASGNASSTVTAITRGSAQITIEAPGSGAAVRATSDVAVGSVLSGLLLVLLLAALVALYFRRIRQTAAT